VKKIKIDIRDLLTVLEAMQADGTTDIIFFEHGELPAIADADYPDDVIAFQIYDESQENKDGEAIH